MSQSLDKTNPFQKALALGLLVATIFGGIWVFNNYLAPFFIDFFTNVWKLTLIGGPLVMIGFYIAFNPLVVWGFFKTLSWNFTKWLIKQDPLSVMDRYVDLLDKKLQNLERIKVKLDGRRIESHKRINDLIGLRDAELKRGKKAVEMMDKNVASMAGTKARGYEDSLRLYKPTYERLVKSVDYLNILNDNWRMSQEKLRFEISRKREDYEVMKDNAKALNQAEAFIKGDTEEGRLYKESVKALEYKMGQGIAYIEDFEKRSKDILAGIRVDNQVQKDEGLQMLEDYIQSGVLLMPTDFSSFEDVDQIVVSNGPKKKFTLLGKPDNNQN